MHRHKQHPGWLRSGVVGKGFGNRFDCIGCAPHERNELNTVVHSDLTALYTYSRLSVDRNVVPAHIQLPSNIHG